MMIMGDDNDDQNTGGTGDDSDGGGGDDIDPPPSTQYRVHRLPGKTFWQIQGLTADESISLEILKQGVTNSKGSISRSHTHWINRFDIADKATIVSVVDIDILTKNESVASREYTEALHELESNFKSYRGLLDIWLKPPHAQGEQQPGPVIDINLYRMILAEIDEQINKVINNHAEVMTGLYKILDKCRRKVEQGGLSFTAGPRSMSSSSCPPPAAPAKKWALVK